MEGAWETSGIRFRHCYQDAGSRALSKLSDQFHPIHTPVRAARLAPYLRYYSSNNPLDDHGHRPRVLVVFDDFLAEGNFLGVARREMERAGVDLPLWISHTGLLGKEGPLGNAWRNPDVLEPTCAFW